MDPCGDEKWKLSKKGRSRSGRSSDSAAAATTSSAVHLSRSYSASVSGTRDAVINTSTASSSSSQQQPGQQSSSRLSKKCVEAVKEQRARFYIVRRCVSMLVCWRDY